jgi:O-antigen ligase
MTQAVQLAVPWALLVAFLACAVKWRIFFLGIPFLMFMGESVFFETMRVFRTPGRLDMYVLLLLWLLVAWALGTGRLLPNRASPGQPSFAAARRRSFLPEELAIVALGALVVGHIVVDSLATADFAGAVGRGLGMLFMIVGYFLIRDIVGHATRREAVMFLGALVLANAAAAVLFILHQGLHVTIYTGGEHSTITFGGEVITRTHYFAPRLVVLAIAFVLARRRWTLQWTLVLLITLASVLVTYTRSLLLIVIAILLITLFAREMKQPTATRLLKRVLGVVCVGIVLLWSFATFLPTESHYLESRLAGLATNPTGSQDSSLRYRSGFLSLTVAIVKRTDPVFGVGFPQPASIPSAAQVETWGADMAWITVVYRLGFAGVFVFGSLFIGFGVRALLLFMRGTGDREYLGLIFLVALVASALWSGISRAFMEPNLLPMGLWLFAFIAAEARRPEESAAADRLSIEGSAG